MKEVRFHGRGGQGIVTATEILALSFFLENKFAQSFPSFGAERRGAPVVSYLRIDERPIRIRMDIHEPDCVVVLDSRLPSVVDVLKGLKKDGIAILNTRKDPSKVELKFRPAKLATVDATEIALRIMSTPITNMAMLGAFAAATNWVTIESVREAIEKRFEKVAVEQNVTAALEAFRKTRVEVA